MTVHVQPTKSKILLSDFFFFFVLFVIIIIIGGGIVVYFKWKSFIARRILTTKIKHIKRN